MERSVEWWPSTRGRPSHLGFDHCPVYFAGACCDATEHGDQPVARAAQRGRPSCGPPLFGLRGARQGRNNDLAAPTVPSAVDPCRYGLFLAGYAGVAGTAGRCTVGPVRDRLMDCGVVLGGLRW
jgi:hypothetical protein